MPMTMSIAFPLYFIIPSLHGTIAHVTVQADSSVKKVSYFLFLLNEHINKSPAEILTTFYKCVKNTSRLDFSILFEGLTFILVYNFCNVILPPIPLSTFLPDKTLSMSAFFVKTSAITFVT